MGKYNSPSESEREEIEKCTQAYEKFLNDSGSIKEDELDALKEKSRSLLTKFPRDSIGLITARRKLVLSQRANEIKC